MIGSEDTLQLLDDILCSIRTVVIDDNHLVGVATAQAQSSVSTTACRVADCTLQSIDEYLACMCLSMRYRQTWTLSFSLYVGKMMENLAIAGECESPLAT